MLPPVERRRAVVGERLAREALVDRLGELPRLAEIGGRGLEPDEVGVRRVRESTRDGCLDPVAHAIEALRGPLAGDEVAVVLVDVAREEGCGERVRAGDEHGRHAADVGGQPRRAERPDELLRRHEYLAAEVAALLLRAELVLVMNPGGARLDHRAHELVGVKRPAETRLGVREDRREPVRPVPPLGVVDLVGAEQGIVEATDDGRNAVHRVEALVRIGRAGEIRVGGDLPAGEVDRLEPGAHHLDGLAAGEGAEGADGLVAVDQLPEPLGAEFGECVLGDDRAAEANDLLRRVRPLDPAPALVRAPPAFELTGRLLDHLASSLVEFRIQDIPRTAVATRSCAQRRRSGIRKRPRAGSSGKRPRRRRPACRRPRARSSPSS